MAPVLVAQERARSLWAQISGWFSPPEPAVALTPMLYVMDPMGVLQDGMSMDVALVAGVIDPVSLDVNSLKLEGDLFCNRATLLTQKIAGSDFPVIRFDGVQLVESLKRDAQTHVSAVGSLNLTGRLSGDKGQILRGQANVQVGRSRV